MAQTEPVVPIHESPALVLDHFVHVAILGQSLLLLVFGVVVAGAGVSARDDVLENFLLPGYFYLHVYNFSRD